MMVWQVIMIIASTWHVTGDKFPLMGRYDTLEACQLHGGDEVENFKINNSGSFSFTNFDWYCAKTEKYIPKTPVVTHRPELDER
jgi:hypothetical protein